jgi:helicase MOV-10
LTQEEFHHFNIFITTCVSTQRFAHSRQKRKTFDYVFIDEAASSTEPESLIPITTFAMDHLTVNSYVCLFGDHKQLGPIVKSEFAAKLGLETSLMERILNTREYQSKEKCVQLLDNFRSHPAILEFPNKLFYESKIRSKLAKEQADTFVGWKSLPNPEVPIVLHSVFDTSVQDGFSWFNNDEVQITRFWVDLLLNEGVNGKKVEGQDIGIVTPYKAQQIRMVQEFGGVEGIEIGTAEHFQGNFSNYFLHFVTTLEPFFY